MERLQKAIAQSGFCSRRKAEEYIIQGKSQGKRKSCRYLRKQSEA